MRMQLCCLFLAAVLLNEAAAAVVRKPPAFAKPIYSDSYLPASMQVIFHAVEQLKRLEADEIEENSLLTPSTSPHPPGQQQPMPTPPSSEGATEVVETSTISDDEKYFEPPERYQEEALILEKPAGNGVNANKFGGTDGGAGITPEVNEEESEVVYAVPEGSYEPVERDEEPSEAGILIEEKKPGAGCGGKKLLGSVESVVKEIYSIVESSSSSLKPGEEVSRDSAAPECIEGKNVALSIEGEGETGDEKSAEAEERLEEQNAEERFTLLGERVDQVPSPSLAAFVRAGNTTKNPSLRQLGELYDALSRDARRQGFSKYTGYSESVLEDLKESAGGGAGRQLKELLEKTVMKKELTRYDAMEKTNDILAILNDDGSKLSTDLRRLLPLRFDP